MKKGRERIRSNDDGSERNKKKKQKKNKGLTPRCFFSDPGDARGRRVPISTRASTHVVRCNLDEASRKGGSPDSGAAGHLPRISSLTRRHETRFLYLRRKTAVLFSFFLLRFFLFDFESLNARFVPFRALSSRTLRLGDDFAALIEHLLSTPIEVSKMRAPHTLPPHCSHPDLTPPVFFNFFHTRKKDHLR